MKVSQITPELIASFNAGDEKALKALFDIYYTPLVLFARSLIQDSMQAEDIVMDHFLKLWKRREKYTDGPGIKAFLYISVRNACFNYLKHLAVQRKSHEELRNSASEIEDDPADIINCSISQAELLDEIIRQVKALPPKMRAITEMIFVQELSTSEISVKLKLSAATIRVQKARALEKLRSLLSGRNPLDTGPHPGG